MCVIWCLKYVQEQLQVN